jgi:hypothetical protein
MFITATQTIDSRHNIYFRQNTPPFNPTITGPTTGRTSQFYMFTVSAFDVDNDPLFYTFHWGDGTREESGLLSDETPCIRNHSWTKAGKYILRVVANDTSSSASSEKTVWIDAVAVGDIGYLLDNDSDGTYDVFHSNITSEETMSRLKNGTYLIDVDGDSHWDYEYNTTTCRLLAYTQHPSLTEKTPFPLLLTASLITVVLVLLGALVVRRRFYKKY